MRDTPAMIRELNVVEQRYQAALQGLEPGIIITAARTTSRDIRRHKAANYEVGHGSYFGSNR